MAALILPEQIRAELVAHAGIEHPAECCGLIACRGDEAVKVLRAANVDPNPRERYRLDPYQQYQLTRGLDREGLVMGAIYHSHPSGDCKPSPTDIQLATYPQALQIIVTLYPETQVKGFWVRAGEAIEAPLTES